MATAIRDADAAFADWLASGLVSDANGDFACGPAQVSSETIGTEQEVSETICFRLVDRAVRLEGPPSLMRLISPLWAGLRQQQTAADLSGAIVLEPNGLGSLTVNGKIAIADAPPEVLIGAFNEALLRALHPDARWCAMIHAGAVSWKGRAAILAAPSGSGKSTPVAYLCAHGFDYLSDDLTPLRADDHCVTPFPLPISVKPGAVAALAPFWPLDLDHKGEAQFLSHDVGFDAPSPRATALVFPKFEAGAATRFEPVSVQDALVRLLSDRIYFGYPIDVGMFESFLRWLRRIDIRELVYSDFTEAERCMTQLLRA